MTATVSNIQTAITINANSSLASLNLFRTKEVSVQNITLADVIKEIPLREVAFITEPILDSSFRVIPDYVLLKNLKTGHSSIQTAPTLNKNKTPVQHMDVLNAILTCPTLVANNSNVLSFGLQNNDMDMVLEVELTPPEAITYYKKEYKVSFLIVNSLGQSELGAFFVFREAKTNLPVYIDSQLMMNENFINLNAGVRLNEVDITEHLKFAESDMKYYLNLLRKSDDLDLSPTDIRQRFVRGVYYYPLIQSGYWSGDEGSKIIQDIAGLVTKDPELAKLPFNTFMYEAAFRFFQDIKGCNGRLIPLIYLIARSGVTI